VISMLGFRRGIGDGVCLRVRCQQQEVDWLMRQ
jgi:hypothetical protein